MRKLRKKISIFLVLCFVVSMLGSCGNTNNKKVETGRKRTRDIVTGKPTASVTGTPEPTEAPTPTGVQNPTQTPRVTPAFGKVTYTDEQEHFNMMLDDFLMAIIGNDCVNVHSVLEYPENYYITEEIGWGDTEDNEYPALCKRWKELFEEVDYNQLTDGQKVNYDRVMYEIEIGMMEDDLNFDLYCGTFGTQGNFVEGVMTNLSEYALLREEDVVNLIGLIRLSPEYFENSFAIAREAYVDNNCLLTEKMISSTVSNIDDYLNSSENPLLVAFDMNIAEAGLSADKVQEYRLALQNELENSFTPAMRKLRDNVESLYSYCDDTMYGLCDKEGGAELFEYLAQIQIGTMMSSEDMFDYLMEHFEDSYNAIVRLASFHPNSIAAYPYTGYTEDDADKILDSLKEYMKDGFPEIPETEYIVSELPKALRPEMACAYFLIPQYDYPSRRVIRTNPDNLKGGVDVFTTLAHEGYPGHLYQIAYFSNCEGTRAINSALMYLGYMEGWTEYIEKEAYYYIIDDAYLAQYYGFDGQFGLDLSAICELGVHCKGWDISDVKDFLGDYGLGSFAEILYDDAVVNPVVYLPYCVGYYLMSDTIAQLMANGYTELEARTAVLNIGPCNYEVLWKHLGIEDQMAERIH